MESRWNDLYIIGRNICKKVNDDYKVIYENVEVNSKTSFIKNGKVKVVHKDYNELIESPYYDDAKYIDDYMSIVINDNRKGVFFCGEEVIKPKYNDIDYYTFHSIKYLNCIKEDNTCDFVVLKDAYGSKINYMESARKISFLPNFIAIYKDDMMYIYDYFNGYKDINVGNTKVFARRLEK